MSELHSNNDLQVQQLPEPSIHEITSKEHKVPTQYIISIDKFIILNIFTFGLYHIWWIFKAWRFFLQKDQSDIMPAMRTIFAIIFLYPLFSKILDYAKEKNYSEDFSKPFLLIIYLLLSVIAQAPDPYWIITFLSFLCLIPAFKALNYAKLHSTEFKTIERTAWGTKYIVTIVIGSIFWMLVLFALYLEMTEPQM
ncbi:DUF4234 domain-containing protein [Acinetobacter shaoyimingii]|uniref:DUF4234 domain-containing protein n=1 Tax=Acinetobacter shaoyimingii TaxID=2715164 RepID=A0A6G8RU14_9GAMM|nr:DUF4234 domain-containing protein [Acinetobacter shaoyimingii]QIO05203.1 DUF4234 domain-containing protein [Acinetobacter shaoyimingii]